MKFLNVHSTNTSYKLVFLILKISGYVFFTVNYSSNEVKFRQTWTDQGIFLVSFLFNLVLFVLGIHTTLNIEIRSVILFIGTNILYKFSLFAIVCTKLVNFIGCQKAFGIIQHFSRIDKKVKIITEYFLAQISIKTKTIWLIYNGKVSSKVV